MTLVKQWNGIEQGLDPSWTEARIALTVGDGERRKRAAALLAPAGPGRHGEAIVFTAARRGGGVGPEAVRRMLRRIDEEGVAGALALLSSAEAPPAPEPSRPSLAARWDAALADLPSDWSDLLCELRIASSDDLERAAVLVGPANPLRDSGRSGFRFRCAQARGYGASPGMVRRCLERLDAEAIAGDVRVLRVLSDTQPVGTQGPVWYVGGKAV